jgi:hypothetical protein
MTTLQAVAECHSPAVPLLLAHPLPLLAGACTAPTAALTPALSGTGGCCVVEPGAGGAAALPLPAGPASALAAACVCCFAVAWACA